MFSCYIKYIVLVNPASGCSNAFSIVGICYNKNVESKSSAHDAFLE